jgi:formylglycine-generating enzyme required for sulfatase activity
MLITGLLQGQQKVHPLRDPSALGKPQKGTEFKVQHTLYHRINDTLYASIFEACNQDYNDFLSYLGDAEYEKYKVDSTQWVQKFVYSYNVPMRIHYNRHEAFFNYPVVNVSHAGAVKYCEWLTRRYSNRLKDYSLTFRLPTEEEWLLLAHYNPQTQLPYHLQNGMKDTFYLMNFKPVVNGKNDYPADGGFYTVRVDGYWPDSCSLFNVIGNVAEMTAIEGVHKGGSWDDILEDCLVDKKQTYPTPDPRVGFRVIAIAERRKPQ